MNINPGDKITAGFLNSLKNVDIRKGTTVKGTDVGNAPVPKLMQVAKNFRLGVDVNSWYGYCYDTFVETRQDQHAFNLEVTPVNEQEDDFDDEGFTVVHSFIGPFRTGDMVYVQRSPYSGVDEVVSGFSGPRLCKIKGTYVGKGFATVHKAEDYEMIVVRGGDDIRENDPPNNVPRAGDDVEVRNLNYPDFFVCNPRNSMLDERVLYIAHRYGNYWAIDNQAVFQDWQYTQFRD